VIRYKTDESQASGGRVITQDKVPLRRSLGLLIVAGGFALRLYGLGAQSLWYDETVSAYLASQSIPDLIAHTARDIHPPGYYLLLHVWTRLAGSSAFALAFFSLACGVLLIALTYALAHRLLGRGVALWSALLVAVSPYNLWYSQEVRMYTLGAVLGMLALWCALNVERNSLTSAAGYALAAALGLYVLYYFAFLLLALNLYIILSLLHRRQLQPLRTWLVAQAAVLILYLPWLSTAWRQATQPPVPAWRAFIPLRIVLLEAWTALSLGQSVQVAYVWPLLILTGTLFLLGLIFRRTRPRPTATSLPPDPGVGFSGQGLLAVYTFGPLALIYLASYIAPLYHVRYVFTYSPPFYVLLGAGLAWLARRIWPLAAVAGLVVLGGSAFSILQMHANPEYAADDFKSAVEFIAQHWRPGDVVLINAGYAYTGFAYYYDGAIAGRMRLSDYGQSPVRPSQAHDRPLLLTTGSITEDPNLGWGDPDSDFYATTQAETAAALEQVTHDFQRIWMLRIYDTVTDPQGFVRQWLATNTTPFETQLFGGQAFMRVQGFMSNYQPMPPPSDPVHLQGGVSLLAWRPGSDIHERAGQPLDVVLWWQVAERSVLLDRPYAVSLKLWGTRSQGSESFLAAQQDEWPLGNLLLTPQWPPDQPMRHPMRLWLPPDLPAGQYRLTLEMYDPSTLEPLPRLDAQGQTISLGSLFLAAN
jgi:mannosyltransferase